MDKMLDANSNSVGAILELILCLPTHYIAICRNKLFAKLLNQNITYI